MNNSTKILGIRTFDIYIKALDDIVLEASRRSEIGANITRHSVARDLLERAILDAANEYGVKVDLENG